MAIDTIFRTGYTDVQNMQKISMELNYSGDNSYKKLMQDQGLLEVCIWDSIKWGEKVRRWDVDSLLGRGDQAQLKTANWEALQQSKEKAGKKLGLQLDIRLGSLRKTKKSVRLRWSEGGTKWHTMTSARDWRCPSMYVHWIPTSLGVSMEVHMPLGGI